MANTKKSSRHPTIYTLFFSCCTSRYPQIEKEKHAPRNRLAPRAGTPGSRRGCSCLEASRAHVSNMSPVVLKQEGLTEEAATKLAVEFPAFFALPRASRERVGFLVGQVRSPLNLCCLDSLVCDPAGMFHVLPTQPVLFVWLLRLAA